MHRLLSEIAELMAVKSKFGGGGEFNPEWMPKVRPPTPFLSSRSPTPPFPLAGRLPARRVQHEEPPPPASPPPAPSSNDAAAA